MAGIAFRPLAEDDLTQLHAWMHNPLVAEWYGLGVENVKFPTLEQIAANFLPRIRGEKPTFCYIVSLEERAIGYIQTYRVGDYLEYSTVIDVNPEAWGIDIFIGEDDCRDRGLGSEILRTFLEREVFSRPGVEMAVIAPNPKNKRAIRSYEKAGFRHVKTVWVPEEGDYEYVMTVRKRS
jgi:RimJ/RimL family protein N-acetyltransferase